MWRVDSDELENEEVEIVVEKGSPEDQMLHLLGRDGVEAEITSISIRAGPPGKHSLVEIEGNLLGPKTPLAFRALVTVSPAGQVNLIHFQQRGDY